MVGWRGEKENNMWIIMESLQKRVFKIPPVKVTVWRDCGKCSVCVGNCLMKMH